MRRPAALLLLLLAFAAGCEEHGKTPQLVACSPDWGGIITKCEAPCVQQSGLGTDTSCMRDDDLEGAIACEPNRFTRTTNGVGGCCVREGDHIAFVECARNPPPDVGLGDTRPCTPHVVIATNHGHVMIVSTDDLAAAFTKTYDIMGTAPHSHQVTLFPSDFLTLQEGGAVTTTSSLDETNTHSHGIRVDCQ